MLLYKYMNQSGLVTGIVMVVIFIIGFLFGRMSGGDTSLPVTNGTSATENTTVGANDSGSGASGDSTTEGATVNTSSLPEGQRRLLETLGLDTNNITITPEMVACAEAELGAARVTEIENGATPSFSEGVTLFRCYGN